MNYRTNRKTDDAKLIELHEKGKTQKEIAEYFGCSSANICKRLKKLIPPELPESVQQLTEKEQSFVLAKASGKSATQAALESFDCSSRDSAKSLGYELMHRPDIELAVSEIMEQEGLTKRYRVRRLKQHVDNRNPDVSLRALDQSWKLDGAYTEKRVNLNISYEDYNKEMRELDAEIKVLEAELGSGEAEFEVDV